MVRPISRDATTNDCTANALPAFHGRVLPDFHSVVVRESISLLEMWADVLAHFFAGGSATAPDLGIPSLGSGSSLPIDTPYTFSSLRDDIGPSAAAAASRFQGVLHTLGLGPSPAPPIPEMHAQLRTPALEPYSPRLYQTGYGLPPDFASAADRIRCAPPESVHSTLFPWHTQSSGYDQSTLNHGSQVQFNIGHQQGGTMFEACDSEPVSRDQLLHILAANQSSLPVQTSGSHELQLQRALGVYPNLRDMVLPDPFASVASQSLGPHFVAASSHDVERNTAVSGGSVVMPEPVKKGLKRPRVKKEVDFAGLGEQTYRAVQQRAALQVQRSADRLNRYNQRRLKHRQVECNRRLRLKSHFEELHDLITSTEPGFMEVAMNATSPDVKSHGTPHQDDILVAAIALIKEYNGRVVAARATAATTALDVAIDDHSERIG